MTTDCQPQIKIDSELRNALPPPSDEQIATLEANLLRDGCRDPLVVWKGHSILLDGHHRYAICRKHGIEFMVKAMAFDSRDAAMVWVIDNQKGRRNVADIDRIALATKKAEIIGRQYLANRDATRRLKRDKMGRLTPVPAKLPEEDKLLNGAVDGLVRTTRAAIAKAAGVGERTYDAGKLVLEAAEKGEIDEKVVEDIRRGRTALHRVAKDVKEKRQRDERQAKRTAALVGWCCLRALAGRRRPTHRPASLRDMRASAEDVRRDSEQYDAAQVDAAVRKAGERMMR